jgi:hypothetical protein
MKKEFVRLQRLQDVSYGDETAEVRDAWLRNVYGSVGTEGYCFAGEDGWDTADFACEDMEFADVSVYDFMGSAYEQERFYAMDFITVREKATGDLYAYETEQIREGAF